MCSIEIVRSKAAVSENSCCTSAGPFARPQRRGVTTYLADSDDWAPAKDEESGEQCYYNVKTGKTSWNVSCRDEHVLWLHATVCDAQLAKRTMDGDGTTLSLMPCVNRRPPPRRASPVPRTAKPANCSWAFLDPFRGLGSDLYHQGATRILIRAPLLRATRCGRHITKRFRATLGRFGGFHHFCPARLQEESSNAPNELSVESCRRARDHARPRCDALSSY